MEPERSFEEVFEGTYFEVLVAGAEGEELLVRVYPETSSRRALWIEPAPAQHPGERLVVAEAPQEPERVPPDAECEAEGHGRVESLSGYVDALALNEALPEEVIEQHQGGRSGDKSNEADEQESPESP